MVVGINLIKPKWFMVVLVADRSVLYKPGNDLLKQAFYSLLYKYIFGWSFGRHDR